MPEATRAVMAEPETNRPKPLSPPCTASQRQSHSETSLTHNRPSGKCYPRAGTHRKDGTAEQTRLPQNWVIRCPSP